MRNFKNLVSNDSNLPIDRLVSRRVIKSNSYPMRSPRFTRSTGIDDTVKSFEEKGIMRWEDANVNYNNPVMTVGIINHEMQETIWMALESLKNQTNIVFSWELIIIEEDSKSRHIITSYIGKLPGCVRILYKSILPGPKLFDHELLESLNIPEKCTAMEKFVDVMNLASKDSIAFVKQDAHSYSPHNRLYNHYMHFNDVHCLVSTQTNGHLYDIDNDEFMIYDGRNIEPYTWDSRCHSLTGITIIPDYHDSPDISVRYSHINVAFRLNVIRDIPVFSTPIQEKDLNDVIFSGILAKTRMRPEESHVVRHDKELDNDGWKSGIHVVKSLSDINMDCIGKASEDNSSHAPEYIIDRLHSLHFHNASNALLKELSHLQSLKEREKAKMERQEREHNDILQHKRELTKVLESRISEEKRLISSHIEEQERIKKQKRALEQASRYRARQEEELIKQNSSLREHLEIEANRIKNDTEIINRRMEELASQKAEEEKLIQERKDKIDNMRRENKELEEARARRVIEESRLSKEVDHLEVVTKEDIEQAEKSADEMRKKIKKLEDQQELERHLILVHEEEYRKLKEQEHNFELEQKARAEQERIVTEEREKLRVKLEENASRIKQEANDMHIQLKEIHNRNLLEKESIAAKKAEKDKIEKEEQELERLLKIRVKQEEILLAAEKEKIGQREKDLVLEKQRHSNREKNLEQRTKALAQEAQRKMNKYRALIRTSEEKNKDIPTQETSMNDKSEDSFVLSKKNIMDYKDSAIIKNCRHLIINNNIAGGSYKWQKNIERHTPLIRVYEYHVLHYVLKGHSNPGNVIVIINSLLHTSITTSDIQNLYYEFDIKIVLPIHEWFWFDISSNYTPTHHSAYLNDSFGLTPDGNMMFMIAYKIICPSKFVYDIVYQHYPHEKVGHYDWEDYKVDSIVNNTEVHKDGAINIGVLSELSEYKGGEQVGYLTNKYNISADVKIFIVGVNIENYEDNYESFVKLLIKYNIHGLLYLNKWGETWCYSLTKGLASGLPILYNNIGSFKERIFKRCDKYIINNNDESEYYNYDMLSINFDRLLSYIKSNKVFINTNTPEYNINTKLIRDNLRIVKKYAVYFPQFHKIAENDINYYEGYTDIVNLKNLYIKNKETPNKKILGLKTIMDYDLVKNNMLIKRQLSLLHDYAIDGFGMYYYWFSTNTITNKNTIMYDIHERFLQEDMGDKKIFYIWANENWSDNPAFGNSCHIIKNDYTDENFRKQADFLMTAFLNKNYLKNRNKPVLYIHHPWFIDHRQIKSFERILHENCVRHRFDGIDLILNNMTGVYENGYSFHPNYKGTRSVSKSGGAFVLDYKSYVENDLGMKSKINTIFFDFDNRARLSNPDKLDKATVCFNNTEEDYIRYLQKLQDYNTEVLLINAWNEWGEKMHVEPSEEKSDYYLRLINEFF